MDYLDTCFVIALAVKSDPNHEAALKLENLVEDPAISELTLCELYTYYSRNARRMPARSVGELEDLVEAMTRYSVKRCRARTVSVDMNDVVAMVKRYAASIPLRTLDLMHAVAAKLVGASRIVTLDKSFAAMREAIEEHLGVKVLTP